MYSLTIFEAFLITHLVMDWIFQWKWEAMNKSKNWTALFLHCAIYTVGFLPVLLIYNFHFSWLLLIFASHVLLDKRNFEIWLVEKFKGFKRGGELDTFWNIVLIGVDQTLHILVLAIIVIFS